MAFFVRAADPEKTKINVGNPTRTPEGRDQQKHQKGVSKGPYLLAPVGVTQQERYGCCEFHKKTKTL